jgi:hypothetical protein
MCPKLSAGLVRRVNGLETAAAKTKKETRSLGGHERCACERVIRGGVLACPGSIQVVGGQRRKAANPPIEDPNSLVSDSLASGPALRSV